MKVSIIIPVYNAENDLSVCLDSIIGQVYFNLEIIVVNDGSKDNSLNILNEYAKKDNRIQVFSHENHGVSYTRNVGINHATGDYIMFIDGDDYIDENYIKSYIDAAKSTDADIVIGGITKILKDGTREIILPDTSSNIHMQNVANQTNGAYGFATNKMYRLGILDDVRFNENMTVQEDLDFALSAYSKTDKIKIINEHDYFYLFEPKRKTFPLLDFIKNQVKIMLAARDIDIDLSVPKKNILNLVFSYLSSKKISDIPTACEDILNQIPDCIINEITDGENKKIFVFRQLVNRKFFIIKLYFTVRKLILKVIR
jgi:glycosyltransferase involved in cell wall biosynthesis